MKLTRIIAVIALLVMTLPALADEPEWTLEATCEAVTVTAVAPTHVLIYIHPDGVVRPTVEEEFIVDTFGDVVSLSGYGEGVWAYSTAVVVDGFSRVENTSGTIDCTLPPELIPAVTLEPEPPTETVQPAVKAPLPTETVQPAVKAPLPTQPRTVVVVVVEPDYDSPWWDAIE